MRWILILWAAPMGIFWGWYFLSLNDVNFGLMMMSRQFHDLFFQLYGDIIGIDPVTIPPLVAKACVFDSLLLMCIWGFRRRRELMAWGRGVRDRYLGIESSPSA